MMQKERWTLGLQGGIAAHVIETWAIRDMPCELRLVRSKKTGGVCCLVADVAKNEGEAIQFLSDVVRVTGCQVSRQPIK